MSFSFIESLTRKKVVKVPKVGEAGELKRCLGKFELIAYGIGTTVGAGVFVLSGLIAKEDSGPSVCLSYLFAGVAAMLSGICYAEFSARYPVAGSAYTYAYSSMGEFIAWVIGWNITLEYGISAAAVASSFSTYLLSLLGEFGLNDIPDGIQPIDIPGTGGNLCFNLIGALLILACTIILMCGVQEFGKLNLIMTFINCSVVVFFIIAGCFFVDTSNWDVFFPYGISGTFSGAARAFFAFVGFDAVSGMSAEAINPQVDIPTGLLGSLSIVTALYCGIGLVMTGMQNYSILDENAPLTGAFKYHDQSWATIVVGIGSVSCMAVITLCSLLGQPRVYYAMSRDGLIGSSFQKLSSKAVPYVGTIVTSIIAGLLAMFLNLDVLADMISAGTLMAFSIVAAGVLLLRLQGLEVSRKLLEGESGESPEMTGNWNEALIAWYFLGNYPMWLISHNVSTDDVPIWALVILGVFLIGIPAAGIISRFYYLQRKAKGSNPDNLPLQYGKVAFMAPFLPFLPLVAILVNGFLFSSLSGITYRNLGIWTFIGLCIYFGYGRTHSAMVKGNVTILRTLSADDIEYDSAVVKCEDKKEIEILKEQDTKA
eukprot:Nk52_evm75s1073 gene=Nk52_evmTU75s1073